MSFVLILAPNVMGGWPAVVGGYPTREDAAAELIELAADHVKPALPSEPKRRRA